MRGGTLFSGIGAPEQAMPWVNWRWCAEIERFPSAVHAARFGTLNLGDVNGVDWDDVEPIDLLVFGSPCQSFSVAGKRLGLDDPRGNLALVALGVARRLRPEWLVFENVPGLLSSDQWRDFGAFLGLLGECGYGWAYRVLDAQYFGVPQRRRRVFAVGHLGDWRRAAAVLFERESLRGNSPPRREAGEGIARPVAFGIDSDCLDRSGEAASGSAGERSGLGIVEEATSALRAKRPGAVAFGGNDTRGPIDVATARSAHAVPHGRCDFESETFVVAQCHGNNVGELGTLRKGDGGVTSGVPFVAHALRAEGFDASEDGTGRGTPLVPIAFDCKAGGETSFSIGEIPGALRGEGHGGGHAAVASLPGVRRLTPRECERLQGFPDDFTLIPYRGKPAADGPRYRALGNSMAVSVVRWIGDRLRIAATIEKECAA